MRSSFMARGISVLLLVVCGGAAAAMADGAAVASEPHSQMQVGSSQHTGQDLSWAFLERLLGSENRHRRRQAAPRWRQWALGRGANGRCAGPWRQSWRGWRYGWRQFNNGASVMT